MTPRPGALANVLNAALGTTLASPAEARAWLNAGGWEQLANWLAANRVDSEDDDAQDAEEAA